MDVAHLVDALKPMTRLGRIRTLALFLVAGCVVVALQRMVARPELPRLVVHVPAGASAEDAIDEAVLLELGLSLPWKSDPLIRQRLAAVGASPDDAPDDGWVGALLRRDPLARARLVERARNALPAPPGSDAPPSDAELAAIAAARGAELARSAVISFEQRFFTRTEPEREVPELVLGRRPVRSVDALASSLGSEAARAIANAPDGVWTRVESRLGIHLVRVIARAEAGPPDIDAIRPRLLAMWRQARRAADERAAIDRMRAGYAIELEIRSAAAR